MELLFESRSNLVWTWGKLLTRQGTPTVMPEPVLVGDTAVDGAGASIYGTVLADGGIYRMWYQAWPRDWNGQDVALVGYAESDDGLNWRKPALGLVEYGGTANNLCTLGFHSPAVFIDPTAPASHRYRATGYTGPSYAGAPSGVTGNGYYAAHSSDGLHWELDSPTPVWRTADVITSMYHPTQARGIACLKRNLRVNGFGRRAFMEAELRQGVWSTETPMMVPDDFDDVCAIARGYSSGDYYGMAMLPAGAGTVGFLWQFRHSLPRTTGSSVGVFGVVDVSLAYQECAGARWLHAPGRRDFLTHGTVPWTQGGIYTASCPVAMGDEHWLYFCGAKHTHGWYVDTQWQVNDTLKQQLVEESMAHIGVARWPKDRLFGLEGDPHGGFALDLGEITTPCSLQVNYVTAPRGQVRVSLWAEGDLPGYAETDCLPLTGDQLTAPVAWKQGTIIHPVPGKRVTANIHVEQAVVYAYDLVPL